MELDPTMKLKPSGEYAVGIFQTLMQQVTKSAGDFSEATTSKHGSPWQLSNKVMSSFLPYEEGGGFQIYQ